MPETDRGTKTVKTNRNSKKGKVLPETDRGTETVKRKSSARNRKRNKNSKKEKFCQNHIEEQKQ